MKKSPVKTFLNMLVLAMAIAATACFANGLQDMWYTNSTQPTSVAVPGRTSFYGGSFVARTAVSNITLMNFQPPHVDAGCSGADIYMGAFSFINKDQIITTFKAIMNNAQGLLFKAAIDFVSPQMGTQMDQFMKILRDLNSMQMNSCAIAAAAVGPITHSGASWATAMGSELVAANDISDWTKMYTDKSAASTAGKDAAIDRNLTMGNLVWKGLKNSHAGTKVNFPMFPSPASLGRIPEIYNDEILMSFTGTYINNSASAAAYSAAAGSGSQNGNVFSPIDSQFGFGDLVSGDSAMHKIVCDDGPAGNPAAKCLTPGSEDIPYIALDVYVDVMLYGDPDWAILTTSQAKVNLDNLQGPYANAGQAAYSPNSIVGILSGAQSGASLTAEQAAFLGSASQPIVNMITSLHGQELVRLPEVINMVKQTIRDGLLANIASSVVTATRNMDSAWVSGQVGVATPGDSGVTATVEFPPDLKQRIVALRLASNEFQNQYYASQDNVAKAEILVRQIIEERRNMFRHN